jgi:hypothetical protein
MPTVEVVQVPHLVMLVAVLELALRDKDLLAEQVLPLATAVAVAPVVLELLVMIQWVVAKAAPAAQDYHLT